MNILPVVFLSGSLMVPFQISNFPGFGDFPAGALCNELATIQAGESRSVRLAGMMWAGQFWDPEFPLCPMDVQPAVAVEFFTPGDRAILDGAKFPLLVAVEGELVGPGKIGQDVADLSPFRAFTQRTAGRLHSGKFRAKLVVRSIVKVVRNVSGDYPAPTQSRPPSPVPQVLAAAMPTYPTLALKAGIEGQVELLVQIVDGQIATITHQAGDRLLADEAETHVRTWVLGERTTGEIHATYIYKLELRKSGTSHSPRISMELPNRVEIIAAKIGWF